MRSNIAFAALLGFALVNTAFLGYYVYSSAAVFGGVSAEVTSTETSSVSFGTTSQATSGTVAMTVTSTNTVSSTGTEPAATTTVPASTVTGNQSATVAGTTTTTTTQTSAAYSVSASATATQSASNSAPTSTSTLSSSPNGLSTTNSASANATFGVPTATKVGAASLTAGLVSFFEDHSLILAPSSWVAVGGMWIWRGRMRSKWTDLGFDSDVFTLFVRMKGAKTRIRLLDALSVPKDRLQLAEELGLDWKSVDRHVAVMKKYGFLDDKLAYGRVRMYQLTPVGMSLLKLLQELSTEDKREGRREDGPYPLLDKGEA